MMPARTRQTRARQAGERRAKQRRQPLRGRAALLLKEELDQASANLSCLDSKETDNEGRDCELHVYEKRIDSHGDDITLRVGAKADYKRVMDKSHTAALVLFRHYSRNRELIETTLEVRSPYIKEAFQAVIKAYPGIKINASGRIVIQGDPRVLFHFRQEIKQYAEESCDPEARHHLRLCLQYMNRTLATEIGAYEMTVTQATINPGLEHRNLWMAYKPGAVLYRKVEGIEILERLQSMSMVEYGMVESSEDEFIKNQVLKKYWRLSTVRVQSDGNNLGYVEHEVLIRHYDGCKAFLQLNIFPLEYHLEKDRVHEKLLARGKKYLSLLGIHHQFYDGVAKLCSSFKPSYRFAETSNISVHNRIIIDCNQFYRDARFGFAFIPGGELITIDPTVQSSLSDEDAMLCDPWIQGYSLKHKVWGHFEVAKIQEVGFNDEAFSTLVLPEGKKDLILSLVQQQDDSGDGFDDLIKGKGKGLIFLLRGPPGVGKTFTAESIADRTKRPLLPLNSGQIIGPAPWVEHRLETILSLATRWKALVLLDEADVFMQERTTKELERNGLVSSLLRIVEYFDGIMFLTTNRFETIDSAFKSRIHLSISYPTLSPTSKKQLWRSSLARACDGQLPAWANPRFLDKVSASMLNGREIKNIVGMAHALARNGHRPMKSADVFVGIQALEAFDADFDRAKTCQGADSSVAGSQGAMRRDISTRSVPWWRKWNIPWA